MRPKKSSSTSTIPAAKKRKVLEQPNQSSNAKRRKKLPTSSEGLPRRPTRKRHERSLAASPPSNDRYIPPLILPPRPKKSARQDAAQNAANAALPSRPKTKCTLPSRPGKKPRPDPDYTPKLSRKSRRASPSKRHSTKQPDGEHSAGLKRKKPSPLPSKPRGKKAAQASARNNAADALPTRPRKSATAREKRTRSESPGLPARSLNLLPSRPRKVLKADPPEICARLSAVSKPIKTDPPVNHSIRTQTSPTPLPLRPRKRTTSPRKLKADVPNPAPARLPSKPRKASNHSLPRKPLKASPPEPASSVPLPLRPRKSAPVKFLKADPPTISLRKPTASAKPRKSLSLLERALKDDPPYEPSDEAPLPSKPRAKFKADAPLPSKPRKAAKPDVASRPGRSTMTSLIDPSLPSKPKKKVLKADPPLPSKPRRPLKADPPLPCKPRKSAEAKPEPASREQPAPLPLPSKPRKSTLPTRPRPSWSVATPNRFRSATSSGNDWSHVTSPKLFSKSFPQKQRTPLSPKISNSPLWRAAATSPRKPPAVLKDFNPKRPKPGLPKKPKGNPQKDPPAPRKMSGTSPQKPKTPSLLDSPPSANARKPIKTYSSPRKKKNALALDMPMKLPAELFEEAVVGKPQSLREMRLNNLKQKSSTTLLLDLFAQRNSEQLEFVELTVHGRVCTKKDHGPVKFQLEHVGVTTTDMMAVVSDLLASGADPGKCDADGFCPLLMALHYKNSYQMVELLIEKDADVGCQQEFGGYRANAVDVALKLGETRTVQLLLGRQAVPTSSGKKATEVKLSSYARSNGFYRPAMSFLNRVLWEALEGRNYALLKDVLTHGALVDTVDKAGRTPLFRAVQDKVDFNIMKLFLRARADPNRRDEHETHLLCFPLLRSGDEALKTVKALLKYKADPAQQSGDGAQTLGEFANETCVDIRIKQLVTSSQFKSNEEILEAIAKGSD